MSLVLKDRVRETTTVLGTNDATLLGAVTGFQAFSVVGNGNTCYYTISDQSGGNWEVGIGTYSTVGPTLARTTILSSSNSGSIVSFPAGTKDVFLTYPSEKAVFLDASGNLNIYSDGELRLNDSAGGEYVALKSPATLAASYTLTMPVDDGTNGQALITDGSGNLSWSTAASGDVYGPASATDNAVVRFDLTTGKLIQNSVAILSDAGALSGLTGVSSTSLTDSGLTSGRVTYASTGGLLADSANLTFDGTYLVANSIKDSALTSGRVTYAGASGLLQDSANLTFDGTTLTAANITSSGTWTISGGTANGVAYLNGSKVLTTGSALTFDGTNNLTVPKEVYQTTAIDYIRIAGGNAAATGANIIVFGQNHATAPGRLALNAVGTGDITYGAVGAHIWSIGSEQMRLTSTGLGIGTSSPQYKLDVSSGSTATTNNSISLAAPAVSGADNVQRIGLRYLGSSAIDAGIGLGYSNLGSSVATYINFGTNNGSSYSEKMRLDSSGNLGLGVTPSAWTAGKAIQVNDVAVSLWGVSGQTVLLNNSYYNSGDKYATTGAASYYLQASGAHKWYTAPSGTAGNAITFTQAMTLDASGNLGIGPGTTPGERLHIYSPSGDPAFRIQSSSGNCYIVSRANTSTMEFLNVMNGPMTFYTNSTERMRIDSSGNVGIGTSSPGAKLDVYNSAAAAVGNEVLRLRYTTATSNATGDLNFTNSSGTALNKISSICTSGSTVDLGFSVYNSGITEVMRITAAGNVGIGTSVNSVFDNVAAARPLVVQSSSSATTAGSSTNSITVCNSDTTTNNLSQINFAAITGASTNQYSSAWIACQYGARTNGQYPTGQLIFATSTSLNNAPSEKMRIDSSGRVLVGTTSSLGTGTAIHSYADGSIALTLKRGTDAGNIANFVAYNGNSVGTISVTDSATAYNTSSDYRLKENIQPMQNALDVVAQLNPVTYTWKADGSDGQGFIAHELQAVVPDCVTGEKDAVDEEGNPVYQGIDTSFLVATLTKAIQEQQEQINQLKAEVAALKGN